MASQERLKTRDEGTPDEGTPERVPFESPPPRESPPQSEVESADVGWVLPLIIFSVVIAGYAGIGYGLYLLLSSLR